MKTASIICILALMSGCSVTSQMSYVLAVDPSATAGQVHNVIEAANEWNACNVTKIVVRQGTPADGEVPVIPVTGLIPGSGGACGNTHIENSGNGSYVQFESGLGIHEVESIAHELGHLQGLNHVPTGLMKWEEGTHVSSVGDMECNNLRASRGM